MGGTSSKVGRGTRVLAKSAAKNQNVGPSAVNTTRPTAESRHKEDTMKVENDDATVAQRLKDLGPVQYKKVQETYVPASEEAFTMTLEARKKQEEQGEAQLEQSGPKQLLHSVTITAILKSLKEGDSPQSVARTYNLDASILPRLARLSVPDRPSPEGANQLLDSDTPQQPVRRRRREPRN